MAQKKIRIVNLSERKGMVQKNKRFTISKQLELLDIPKSTYYYRSKKVSIQEIKIMRKMDEMYLEDPTRGTRRFSSDLKLEGIQIGRSKVKKLMQIMGIYALYPKPRTTVIDPTKYKYPYLLRGLKIKRSNQVWGIDISYIPMKKGFMYLCAIIDHHSRFVVGWDISNHMDSDWVVSVLKKAIKEHGKPDVINSDQGTQFTSMTYVDFIKSFKTIKISMDGKGRATDNAYIERFFRTIKYDKIYLNPPADGNELFKMCKEFINFYNCKRSHSSIGKVPPVRVYKRAA